MARREVQIAIAADVLHVHEVRVVGGVERCAPVIGVLHGTEADHVDLARVVEVIDGVAGDRRVEEVDAARAGALRVQVIAGEQHREPLGRLEQEVRAGADIIL
jgi:hypothetical protein